MKEPFLLVKVPLKCFSIQKDHSDYPSRRGERLFRQGLSQIRHLDGSFSGSSKLVLNPGPRWPQARTPLTPAAVSKCHCQWMDCSLIRSLPACQTCMGGIGVANIPEVVSDGRRGHSEPVLLELLQFIVNPFQGNGSKFRVLYQLCTPCPQRTTAWEGRGTHEKVFYTAAIITLSGFS